jgi:hypothetical protein
MNSLSQNAFCLYLLYTFFLIVKAALVVAQLLFVLKSLQAEHSECWKRNDVACSVSSLLKLCSLVHVVSHFINNAIFFREVWGVRS